MKFLRDDVVTREGGCFGRSLLRDDVATRRGLFLEDFATRGGLFREGGDCHHEMMLQREGVVREKGFYKVVNMREFVEFHIVRFEHPSLLRVNGHGPLE